MAQLNTWSDVSSISASVYEDAYFIVREAGFLQNFVKVFSDARGGNLRTGYGYNSVTATTIAETDDLTSSALTLSAKQTLTPAEIGAQFFITDLRIDSESPSTILTDAARELGFSAADKINGDIVGDMANFTGGTVGAAGTAITWGYMAAAIAQARAASKSTSVPLVAVIHGYQAAVLAKAASVAGATIITTPATNDLVTSKGMAQSFSFMGVPIYQVFNAVDTGIDFKGGVFPKDAIALDWRRGIKIESERDASRRGIELNMSAVYAHGVWRPDLGITLYFDAATPTS